MERRARPTSGRRRIQALASALGIALLGVVLWLQWSTVDEQGAVAATLGVGRGVDPGTSEASDASGDVTRATDGPTRTASEAIATDARQAPATDARAAELRGRVVDTARVPVAGARVSIRRGEARGFGVLDPQVGRATEVVGDTESDELGEFRFELERGMAVDLHVDGHGFCPEIVADRHAGEFVEVVLSAGFLAFGRVTRQRDGAPIAAARVRVFRLGGPSTLERRTETGVDGRYEVRFTFRERAVLEIVPRVEASSGWIDLTLGPGDVVENDVALPDGIVVTGRVTEPGGRIPIPGAVVGEGWTYRKATETDAFGEYRLTGFGDTGGGELFAKARGFGQTKRVDLPGAVDGVMRVDFELARARSAFGRVVGTDGAPIAGVLAAAIASEHGADGQRTDWCSDHTDAAGRFHIEDMTHDLRHALLLSKRGFATRVYDFPESEMREPELDLGTIVLGAPALLAGVVAYQGGAGIPDATVVLKGWNSDRFRLLDEGEERSGLIGDWYVDSRSTRTDALGRFSFGDVAAGSYSLHARGLGAESAGLPVAIAEGEIRDDVVLSFPREGVLRGRVVDPEGQAVAGVYLSAYALELRGAGGPAGGPVSVRADSGGRFEFRGLRAGAYRIQAFPWAVESSAEAPLLPTDVDRVETDSGEIEIVIERGTTIRGVVTAGSGAAMFGYSVVAVGPDGPMYSTTTDAAGAFALAVARGTLWDVEVRGAPGTAAWSTVYVTQPAVAAGTRGLDLAVP